MAGGFSMMGASVPTVESGWMSEDVGPTVTDSGINHCLRDRLILGFTTAYPSNTSSAPSSESESTVGSAAHPD